MSNELLAVLGAIITFMLAVNAWYFKGIVTGIQKIEIELAKLITEKDYMGRMVLNHDHEIKAIRERLHDIEGSTNQVLTFIKEQ